MQLGSKRKRAAIGAGLVWLAVASVPVGATDSSGGSGGGGTAPLSSVAVPVPPGLQSYVRDPQALKALGKALFWDMQVGNDGKQACASCHFHAGADHRRTNQINGNGSPFTPNYTLGAADFPFHTSAVVGSAGVYDRTFGDVVPGNSVDDGFSVVDPTYNVSGVSTRRVTGRNAPSVVNAVFNVRNFWDGRAKDVFTVFTPFGDSDPNNNIVMESGGVLAPLKARLQNSGLASQSVGPANNPVEMSSAGRSWQKLGKKMLSLAPLAKQRVHPSDSVLGSYANPSGPGLKPTITYASLIQAAFQPSYWSSQRLVDASGHDMGMGSSSGDTNKYSQMEYNFALFWGLAVQSYESGLVSDATAYDAFAQGSNAALSPLAKQGLSIFQGKGQCSKCHVGPEFAGGTYTDLRLHGVTETITGEHITDTGFFRTGVRPISDDKGLGGNDGFGKPLSNAVQLNPTLAAVNGAFRAPTVRNVEFTGPYFHNGSAATLEQVVEFYNRGGDFPGDGNLGKGIQPLNLSATEKAALVEFMKALSDDRVRFQRAPFDHPQLCVPNGAQTLPGGGVALNGSSDSRFQNEGADNMVEIPEVGANGGVALQTFAELVGATTADGPRANTLASACSIR